MEHTIIIPLKKKYYQNHTNEENLLYFFKEEKVYLMDNHRLSFWCFLEKIKEKNFGKYVYVHIDDHFDAGDINNQELANQIKKNGLNFYKNINNFRNDEIITSNGKYKTFNYGNYLMPAIFYNFFDNNKLYFLVKQDKNIYLKGGLNDECFFNENIPKIIHYKRKRICDLKKILQRENNIVLNIDFDYFFNFKPNIIKEYFSAIKDKIENIKFILISLTTSSNNWEKEEKILKIFSDVFEIKIKIPLEYDT